MKKIATILSLLLTASTVLAAESQSKNNLGPVMIDGQGAIQTKNGIITALEEEVSERYGLEFRNQNSLESIRLESAFLLKFLDIAEKTQLKTPSKNLRASAYVEQMDEFSVAISPAIAEPTILESWSGSVNDKIKDHVLLKSASQSDIEAGVQKYIRYIKSSFGFTSKKR